MTRTLNQQKRSAHARDCWKYIVRSYNARRPITAIAQRFDVSACTITKILDAHQASRRHKAARPLTNKEIAARLAACRLPDIEFWQCRSCGRNFNGKIQPFQYPCGSVTFDFIKARRRLDLSVLDVIDGGDSAKQSLVARKIHLSEGACV